MSSGRRLLWVVVPALAAVLAFVFFTRGGRSRLPVPGSEPYEQATRAFYHGLAALEVGLLDDARTQFTRATEIVSEEPASWANLALTHLRLGELETAAGPIERALALAPDNPDVLLLAGRMETSRGRLDEGIARLRRAVELDARGVRSRMALAEEVERAGGDGAEARALRLLDEVAERAPSNVAVLLERARLAARAADGTRLSEAVDRLAAFASSWPPQVQQQYAALQAAARSGLFAEAVRATILLRNVLVRVPTFLEGLADVRTPTELVAEPFMRFLALQPASATPSPRDESLTFVAQTLGVPGSVADVAVAAWLGDGPRPSVLALGSDGIRELGDPGRRWAVAGPAPRAAAIGPTTTAPQGLPARVRPLDARVLALDWDHDFRPDLLTVGDDGLRLFLQRDGGRFSPEAPGPGRTAFFACVCTGAWAADVEMDGDLDVVAAVHEQPPIVLRNNGDGTWRDVRPFEGVLGARGFAWADVDQDADPDAVFLDASGAVAIFANQQAGQFVRIASPPGAGAAVAMTVADVNADGVFDLLLLERTGVIRRHSYASTGWTTDSVGAWPDLDDVESGRYRLLVADLDNNGGVDLVASGGGATRVWLSDEVHAWHERSEVLDGEVFSVADLEGRGRLDLVGTSGGRPTRFVTQGSAGYHWKVVRVRAQQNAGDQRINAFGVGGTVEVRSGLLVQRHVLTGAPVHIGLGTHATIDVARIVWPNGVPQAEFGVGVDDTIVAEQRLKGSCPWVFAWDGRGIGFVTDFLWRSPLGLRINAQETAGVAQTEDWVRIREDQLVARDGAYDIRITGELWETHFFDHVSLLVVDHPADVEAFVDERFSPASPPALEVRALSSRQAVVAAHDHQGRDVTALVATADGRSVAAFERGPYQGIALDHWVEIELPAAVSSHGLPTLVATGWIYPTDSSINVAVGQGTRERPRGIALEVGDGRGRWTVVQADLGFPAGKNKTMLIDLRPAVGATRLRLRTNLEVYWDAIAVATGVDAPLRVTRLAASSADLRYRGFSRTVSPRAEAPETPRYDQLAGVSQRWRDLEGYHTRFGDVRELVRDVDDRYVIMNAGDEMRLSFQAPASPADGSRRDFVLVGDGWEKDGDYNTEFSRTVLPLPSHENPAYRGNGSGALEDDPVYLRHREDWEHYHTRYVAPRTFVDGLRRR